MISFAFLIYKEEVLKAIFDINQSKVTTFSSDLAQPNMAFSVWFQSSSIAQIAFVFICLAFSVKV